MPFCLHLFEDFWQPDLFCYIKPTANSSLSDFLTVITSLILSLRVYIISCCAEPYTLQ